MLHFKVKEILEASGKKFPSAWLVKHCGFSLPKAHNIVNNKQKSINLKDFSKLCENLNCTPNDLMYWDQSKFNPLLDSHPCITKLTKPTKNSNWFTIFSKLPPDKILELHAIAEEKLEGK